MISQKSEVNSVSESFWIAARHICSSESNIVETIYFGAIAGAVSGAAYASEGVNELAITGKVLFNFASFVVCATFFKFDRAYRKARKMPRGQTPIL